MYLTFSSSSSSSSGEEEPIINDPDKVMLFQAVLVYIGAVPVPHLHLTRRHVIRCAVQSLRAQHAKARTVQMQIFPDQVGLRYLKQYCVICYTVAYLFCERGCIPFYSSW